MTISEIIFAWATYRRTCTAAANQPIVVQCIASSNVGPTDSWTVIVRGRVKLVAFILRNSPYYIFRIVFEFFPIL